MLNDIRKSIAYTYLNWAIKMMPVCREKVELIHHLEEFVRWKGKYMGI